MSGIQTLKALIGALLPFNLAGVTILFNQACDLLPRITGKWLYVNCSG